MPDHPSDDADDAVVIRSEEELRVSTRRRAVRAARLRKTTETRTETVTRTIPLRREHVEIEYVALGENAGRPAGQPAAADERWLVLYEEEIVVQTRWVARERVRLAVRTITEDREITEFVRRERLVVDDRSVRE